MVAARDQLQRFLGLAPPEWISSLDRHLRAAPPGPTAACGPHPARGRGNPSPPAFIAPPELPRALLARLEAVAGLPPDAARASLAAPIAGLAVLALGGNARATKAMGCLAAGRTAWAGPVREINLRRRFFTQLMGARGPQAFGHAIAQFHRTILDQMPLALLAPHGERLVIEPFLRERLGEIAWGPSAVIAEIFEARFGGKPSAAAQRVRRNIVAVHQQTLALLSDGFPEGMLAKFALRLSSAPGEIRELTRALVRIVFVAALTAIQSGASVSVEGPSHLRFHEGFDPSRLAPIVSGLVRDAALRLMAEGDETGGPARLASRASGCCTGDARVAGGRFLRVRWEPLRRALAIEDDGHPRPGVSEELRDRIVAIGWGMSMSQEVGRGTRVLLHPREGDIVGGVTLPLFPLERSLAMRDQLVEGAARLMRRDSATRSSSS